MLGFWRLGVLLKRLDNRLKLARAEFFCARFSKRPPGRHHGLDGDLVVSLTSYPPRYPTLAKTLVSLLSQSVTADRIVLWIAHSDLDSLPPAVRRLEAHGLEIRACNDWRSFKKLLPALMLWPRATHVTADDDVFYPSDWLAALVRTAAVHPRTVVAHRANLARLDEAGCLMPYNTWEMATSSVTDRSPREFLFPTGVGGVLYPPDSLAEQVLDVAAALRLCPHGDDIWFFWMAKRAGTPQRLADRPILHPLTWDGSQEIGLLNENWLGGRNDEQVRAMEQELGNLGTGVNLGKGHARHDARTALQA